MILKVPVRFFTSVIFNPYHTTSKIQQFPTVQRKNYPLLSPSRLGATAVSSPTLVQWKANLRKKMFCP